MDKNCSQTPREDSKLIASGSDGFSTEACASQKTIGRIARDTRCSDYRSYALGNNGELSDNFYLVIGDNGGCDGGCGGCCGWQLPASFWSSVGEWKENGNDHITIGL